MGTQVIDRLETNRAEKSNKLFFYLGLGAFVLLVLKIYFNPNKLGSTGFWFDLLVMALPIYLMYKGYKTTKNRVGQFIEWQENQISYKLREDSTKQTIPLESIENITIGLEEVRLKTTRGERVLNIADFTDYETIKRLKGNFEKMKNNVA